MELTSSVYLGPLSKTNKVLLQCENTLNVIYTEESAMLALLFKITRGPRAFYRSPDNQQQTVQSEKKTTKMTVFK